MTDFLNEKSRSQKKRESTALQDLGEELASLPVDLLQTLSLAPALLEAFSDLQHIKKHEARRRQMQYVGRLMREIPNPEELKVRVSEARSSQNKDNVFFEKVEKLRASLLVEEEAGRMEALNALALRYPILDRAKTLRLQEASLAAPESAEQKNRTKASRELFRYLRGLLERAEEDVDCVEP